MTRPRLPQSDIQRQRGIRLSDSEWRDMCERAKLADMRPADYARRLLTKHRIAAPISIADRPIWIELAHTQSNLNQLSRTLNLTSKTGGQSGITIDQLQEAIDDCRRLTAALRDDISGVRKCESESESL